MNKLVGIGELLVDFTSLDINNSKYQKNAGGAPANVCAQIAKLGGESVYLSQVGNDDFGNFLINSLKEVNVNTSFIKKNVKYETSLAFVSLKEDGDRSFTFYRKNAADLYFDHNTFKDIILNKYDILEFGSVALKTEESRSAHDFVIKKAKLNNNIIAFDPNLRFNLWQDHIEMRKIILDYIKFCDILKVSDEEVRFITSEMDINKSIDLLFDLGLKIILLTKGSNGATLYLKNGKVYNHLGYKTDSVDTTGAGDSSFGGFLSELLKLNLNKDNLLDSFIDYNNILDISMICGSYSTKSYGAIASMITKDKLEELKK